MAGPGTLSLSLSLSLSKSPDQDPGRENSRHKQKHDFQDCQSLQDFHGFQDVQAFQDSQDAKMLAPPSTQVPRGSEFQDGRARRKSLGI